MNKIIEIVSDILEVELSECDLEKQLSDYGWDSLSALQLIVISKNEFGLSLNGAQVSEIKTLSDICQLLGHHS
jgi:acyl carrier protein